MSLSRIFLTQKEPLSVDQITEKLRELRKSSSCDSSGFAVAVILEIKTTNGLFNYMSGVNFENRYHNRLAIHAEQSALATAKCLIDEKFIITKIFVMGAPKEVQAGDPNGNGTCRMCGQCRQILLSYADDETFVYSISVNGECPTPLLLTHLIPLNFSERDFPPTAHSKQNSNATTQRQIKNLVSTTTEIKPIDILNYLRHLETSAHVFSETCRTSPVSACILTVSQDDVIHYVPGVLMQDLAFGSIDAIFSALGQTITRFGEKPFEVLEANLIGNISLDDSPLSPIEIQMLNHFAKSDIPVNFYAMQGANRNYLLSDCWEMIAQKMFFKLRDESTEPVASATGFAETSPHVR